MLVDPRKITHYLPAEIVEAEYDHPRRLKGRETHDDGILMHLIPVMDLPKIKYCYEHFVNGVPWSELPIEGTLQRFDVIDAIYKQGAILDKSNDNVLVHLFNDEIYFAGGGFHRLAIAKILQLESIPVDVGLIYKGR
jgi:hypothetical protein